ncbi:hypothetical protein JCM6882_008198 [Rhodosporidiobolus microsporus]
MGNDGGSIPKRGELVRTKQTRARENDEDRVRQLWAFCALSKQPLRQPVVSCPYGRLYNKEALISYLLNPPSTSETSPFGNDGLLIAGHIRSLKDVTTLRLTANPALPSGDDEHQDAAANAGTMQDSQPAQFVCPISLREMNGSVRFVYRKPCGCVMAEAALKEMRRGVSANGAAAAKEAEQGGELSDEHVCPVDGERSEQPEEWVTLNPKEDELELVKERWEARKLREKEEKKKAKAAKRKNGGGSAAEAGEDGGDAKPLKKKQKTDAAAAKAAAAAAPGVKAGSTVPQLQATLAAKLAEEKKKHSPAIASLYAKKGEDEMRDKDGRSNWMTVGAYSRF